MSLREWVFLWHPLPSFSLHLLLSLLCVLICLWLVISRPGSVIITCSRLILLFHTSTLHVWVVFFLLSEKQPLSNKPSLLSFAQFAFISFLFSSPIFLVYSYWPVPIDYLILICSSLIPLSHSFPPPHSHLLISSSFPLDLKFLYPHNPHPSFLRSHSLPCLYAYPCFFRLLFLVTGLAWFFWFWFTLFNWALRMSIIPHSLLTMCIGIPPHTLPFRPAGSHSLTPCSFDSHIPTVIMSHVASAISPITHLSAPFATCFTHFHHVPFFDIPSGFLRYFPPRLEGCFHSVFLIPLYLISLFCFPSFVYPFVNFCDSEREGRERKCR